MYGHLSMQGSDPTIPDELYQGTAKNAEGYLTNTLVEKAKEEGYHIEVS